MSCRHQNRAGFTAIEITFALGLLVIALTGALTGWMFVMRGERESSLQAELDIDVRSAMEWLKSDLRLSAMDHIYYYPDGAGPYTGLSFPMARDDGLDGIPGTEDEEEGDGYVELDGDNKIIWDRTVVYHVWPASPYQLRKTVFDPRDNSLSDAERQEQLNSVVANGSGEYTHNQDKATTMAIFENLFTWSIRSKGALFDAYNPTVSRQSTSFGSVLLSDGPHDYKVTVVGKNDLSSGYKVGLDSFIPSACGIDREGEAQLPATEVSGPSPYEEYMAGGSWRGNYQLKFPGTAPEQYFVLTMNNDRWEETNFRDDVGSLASNTVVRFDETLTPKDFVVRLAGGEGETNWYAQYQTGDLQVHTTTADALQSAAVRVLIRGGEMIAGSTLDHSGGNCKIRFDAGQPGFLKVEAAYIAEAADHENPTPNINASTLRPLYFSGNKSKVISSGWGDAWAKPWGAPCPIERNKSYVVMFLVGSGASIGCAEYFDESATNAPGCYVIPGTNSPDEVDLIAADWSTKPYVESKELYAVKFMETTYATNGTFASYVADTHLDNPSYMSMTWASDQPAGTAIDVKVRAGNTNNLEGVAWQSGVGGLSGRYVQFMAELESNNHPDFSLCETPKLKDVTIGWTGVDKIVDIGGTVTTGPDYGVFGVTVDGKALVGGMQIELEIFEELVGYGGNKKLVTSSMSAEIEPRNTGK